jgi:single-stranded DNA-binding protein
MMMLDGRPTEGQNSNGFAPQSSQQQGGFAPQSQPMNHANNFDSFDDDIPF